MKPNFQRLALLAKRPGQTVVKAGTYAWCDLYLRPYPGAVPVELKPGDVFPPAPPGCLWKRVIDDDDARDCPA